MHNNSDTTLFCQVTAQTSSNEMYVISIIWNGSLILDSQSV